MLNDALVDDLNDIGLDVDNYEAPKPPTPPAKGSYTAKLTRWQEDTDRSTGALKSPYTVVANFEITEGPSAGRFFTFQRISSRPYKTRAGASQLNDFLAVLAQATNHEGSVKGREAIGKLLDIARDTNATFRIRTDWEAYDKDYINNVKADGRTPENTDYETARIKGQRNFNADGTVTGPSGTTLTAQGVVTGFGA